MVDDAIRFVSQKAIEKIKSASDINGDYKEESNEPDYDEHKDQIEEEQDEETGETAAATINKVF